MPRNRLTTRKIQSDTLGNQGDILEHADILGILQAARVTLLDWKSSADTILGNLTDRIESLESSRTQAASVLSDHGGRLNALETWRTNATQTVQSMQSALSDLTDRVDALEIL